MRMWVAAVVSALAIAGAAGCKGESEQSKYLASLPEANEVRLVDPATYPPSDQVPLPMVRAQDAERIEWLVAQLRDGRVGGRLPEAGIFLHSNVPSFALYRTDGTTIAFWPGWNCREEPGGQSCNPDPRYITVFAGDTYWRVAAEPLAAWLRDEWQDDFPLASRDQRVQAFAGVFTEPVMPRAEDVSGIVLGQGGPFQPEVPLPLDPLRPEERETISKVAGWLAEASEAGEVAGTSEFMDRSGTSIVVRTSTGWFSVGTASQCTRGESSLSCLPVADEVIVFGWNPASSEVAKRLHSPELAEWLNGGWRADFRMGTHEEKQAALKR